MFIECFGAPGEIRTPGLLVRSQTLYPAELRAHRCEKILSRQVGFGQNSSSHGKLHDSFCESWSARHACRQLSFVELDKVKIPAYEMLRKDCGFGQHMLGSLLRGVSTREYQEVLPQMAATVGVSRSTISRKAVEARVEQLQQLQEGGAGTPSRFR
jgi:hypothetical protein